MTDEQINATIAKELGWTQVEAIHRSGRAPGATYVGREFIPDYCTDLNAMHEAEESLAGDLWIGYVNKLADIEGSLFGIRATARQRAEAFLRTLGKWEEVQG